MRILIACEESDEVRSRFEKMGFDAWSCDLQPNRNPDAKHYQCDVFQIINDGWDLMIAFPPCTHLAVSGAAWFEAKRKDGRQQSAINFFMKVVNSDIKYIGIENPVGIMSRLYRKPDQIIQPYYFGDEAQKTTCLWLKNLPLLFHSSGPDLFNDKVTHVGKGNFRTAPSGRTYPEWCYKFGSGCSKERSKTYPGIAQAMAEQWGKFLIEKEGMEFRKLPLSKTAVSRTYFICNMSAVGFKNQ